MTTTFNVTVNNVAPTASATNNGPIAEGSSATITVTATDPAGANDPLSYRFDCTNDGTYELGPQAGNSTPCAYADDGSYTAKFEVTDGDGGSATVPNLRTPYPPAASSRARGQRGLGRPRRPRPGSPRRSPAPLLAEPRALPAPSGATPPLHHAQYRTCQAHPRVSWPWLAAQTAERGSRPG